ncbi:acidic phospholipase A2 PA4 [Drosophila takahashii]|uniref:acidic phospholipase A2 PA4 n=1 Tax=Drosophila takahashii TaxID=29030 RepID=UPI001CF913C7|nr:acidic phospholipase A2 PA4 [Drosophila takahashii]
MWIPNESSGSTICVLMPLAILATWQLCAVPGTDAKHLAARSHDPETEAPSQIHAHSHPTGDAAAAVRRRERRQLSDWLIAPNTRWCGRGNLANGTYNDLGGASKADKCCRKHDHCKMWIDGMSNRYDLFNYRPYTLSHCSCDLRFRTCLKMAGDEDANAIGKLFFNVVQTQCFGLKAETVCVQRGGSGKESDPCLKEETRQKAFLRNNKRF